MAAAAAWRCAGCGCAYNPPAAASCGECGGAPSAAVGGAVDVEAAVLRVEAALADPDVRASAYGTYTDPLAWGAGGGGDVASAGGVSPAPRLPPSTYTIESSEHGKGWRVQLAPEILGSPSDGCVVVTLECCGVGATDATFERYFDLVRQERVRGEQLRGDCDGDGDGDGGDDAPIRGFVLVVASDAEAAHISGVWDAFTRSHASPAPAPVVPLTLGSGVVFSEALREAVAGVLRRRPAGPPLRAQQRTWSPPLPAELEPDAPDPAGAALPDATAPPLKAAEARVAPVCDASMPAQTVRSADTYKSPPPQAGHNCGPPGDHERVVRRHGRPPAEMETREGLHALRGETPAPAAPTAAALRLSPAVGRGLSPQRPGAHDDGRGGGGPAVDPEHAQHASSSRIHAALSLSAGVGVGGSAAMATARPTPAPPDGPREPPAPATTATTSGAAATSPDSARRISSSGEHAPPAPPGAAAVDAAAARALVAASPPSAVTAASAAGCPDAPPRLDAAGLSRCTTAATTVTAAPAREECSGIHGRGAHGCAAPTPPPSTTTSVPAAHGCAGRAGALSHLHAHMLRDRVDAVDTRSADDHTEDHSRSHNPHRGAAAGTVEQQHTAGAKPLRVSPLPDFSAVDAAEGAGGGVPPLRLAPPPPLRAPVVADRCEAESDNADYHHSPRDGVVQAGPLRSPHAPVHAGGAGSPAPQAPLAGWRRSPAPPTQHPSATARPTPGLAASPTHDTHIAAGGGGRASANAGNIPPDTRDVSPPARRLGRASPGVIAALGTAIVGAPRTPTVGANGSDRGGTNAPSNEWGGATAFEPRPQRPGLPLKLAPHSESHTRPPPPLYDLEKVKEAKEAAAQVVAKEEIHDPLRAPPAARTGPSLNNDPLPVRAGPLAPLHANVQHAHGPRGYAAIGEAAKRVIAAAAASDPPTEKAKGGANGRDGAAGGLRMAPPAPWHTMSPHERQASASPPPRQPGGASSRSVYASGTQSRWQVPVDMAEDDANTTTRGAPSRDVYLSAALLRPTPIADAWCGSRSRYFAPSPTAPPCVSPPQAAAADGRGSFPSPLPLPPPVQVRAPAPASPALGNGVPPRSPLPGTHTQPPMHPHPHPQVTDDPPPLSPPCPPSDAAAQRRAARRSALLEELRLLDALDAGHAGSGGSEPSAAPPPTARTRTPSPAAKPAPQVNQPLPAGGAVAHRGAWAHPPSPVLPAQNPPGPSGAMPTVYAASPSAYARAYGPVGPTRAAPGLRGGVEELLSQQQQPRPAAAPPTAGSHGIPVPGGIGVLPAAAAPAPPADRRVAAPREATPSALLPAGRVGAGALGPPLPAGGSERTHERTPTSVALLRRSSGGGSRRGVSGSGSTGVPGAPPPPHANTMPQRVITSTAQLGAGMGVAGHVLRAAGTVAHHPPPPRAFVPREDADGWIRGGGHDARVCREGSAATDVF